VVHLARTPCPASKDVKDESAVDSTQALSKVEHLKPLKSVQDIQETWVVDHAEHVSISLFTLMYFRKEKYLNEQSEGHAHT
jgi:hypothetical protein